jgi:uroporphyrin-III C-methyltransferase
VRLKGGDPSVFGRLQEELQALSNAGIACEVVPGVTAALAAAADAQRPLTRRGVGRSVSLTTAMTQSAEPDEGPKAGHLQKTRAHAHADTEVFYMAGRQLGALGRALRGAGWPVDTPIFAVSRAGWPDSVCSSHTVADLGSAAVLHAGRPTVVTVGAGAVAVVAVVSVPRVATAPVAQSPTSAKAPAPVRTSTTPQSARANAT